MSAPTELSPLQYELLVVAGEELRTFDLPAQAEVTIGRDETNHVQIEHPSVSRRHARLLIGSPIVIGDRPSCSWLRKFLLYPLRDVR